MKDQKKRNDIILAVVMILVAAAGFLWYNLAKEEGAAVMLIQNGEEVQSFSLNDEVEYLIETEDDSFNLLVIQGGKAFMKEASCPDQICVNHRPVSNVGETIVCLPNEIVIKVIEKNSQSEIDMVI
ncbi:MAG: NusG domain II-containing protein [Firmicutes bacterium]|nr:NusG domain II-containing protein [Bacillota bacterium]